MKKVLIISYHFPPLNVVASKRSKAYADYLYKHDIRPIILTHFRTTDEQIVHQSYFVKNQKNPNYDEVLVSSSNDRWGKYLSSFSKFPIFKRLIILIRWSMGLLDPEGELRSYSNFKTAAYTEIKKQNIDLVIGIFNPHFSLKLAYDINQKFKIPYILDFRDLWASHIFTPKENRNRTQKLQDYFTQFYWKKWINQASTYSITSPEWLLILEKLTQSKGHVIPNGFNDELLQISSPKTPHFSIGCMGTMYVNQDLDTFLEGLWRFISRLSKEDQASIKLECLGLNKRYRPKLEEEIKKYIPAENVSFLPKTDQAGVIHFCQSLTLIWHPAFPDSKGWFSAKIYDYLASKSPILFSPSDNGIVENTLEHFTHIHFSNDSNNVEKLLMEKFETWKQGEIESISNNQLNDLSKFTRSSQASKMATIINKVIRND